MMTETSSYVRSARKLLRDANKRSMVYQGLILLAVGLAVWFLIANVVHNLAARNIATGFAFLNDEAGFAIGETSFIGYSATDTYGRAIVVGLLNTLRVAVISIIAATLLGTVLGLGRLSRNWLVRQVAGAYVEVMRNTPLLLQLFFWYALITETMPGPRQAYHPFAGVFVSNRGLQLPGLQGDALDGLILSVCGALLIVLLVLHYFRRRPDSRARIRGWGYGLLFLMVALPAAGWLLGGGSVSLDLPQLKGFNFVGGITLSPEFTALLLGLVLYTSAFVAEVVRAGVQSVPKGQWEAAAALGLSRYAILRSIVLPQALRVIIPPMTSQYLNVTKNSSLAVAIGYPDIVSIANTTLNQTGQAIEGILIIMAVYLAISLFISLLMNIYNSRMALTQR